MSEVKFNNTAADQLRSQFPSNSIISNGQPNHHQQREKVTSVVKGKATIKKDTLGEKIRKMFFPGDIKDLKQYALNQILIPNIKNGVLALVELTLFGTVNRRSVSSSRTNYSYISTNANNVASPPTITQKDRINHNFQNVIFNSYEDAEDVISTLLDLVDRYGSARVTDFYDAAGIDSDWASVKWGWTSFQRLETRAVPGGYVIDISQPVLLK